MLEYEIEIGKEEQDALLEIALNSKEYRKKRKAEAIKFSILIVACILIIIWRVTNSDTRLVVLCSLLAAYSLFMICGGSKLSNGFGYIIGCKSACKKEHFVGFR